MKIKVWCLFLAVVLAAAFAGCSADHARSTDAAETSAGTAGEKDLGGYEFVLAGADELNPSGNEWRGTSCADQLSAIYAEIESEYGCKIRFTELSDGAEAVIAAISSGTAINGFAYLSQNEWVPLVAKGALMPLDTDKMRGAGLDVNNVDCFFQPYTHLSDFILKGEKHIYGVDLSGVYLKPYPGYLYAFNKTLTAAAGYTEDSVFKLVYDRQWTYEKMLEIAAKIPKDADGDGTQEHFGVALGCPEGEALSNGTGPIAYDTAAGKWKANLADAKFTVSLSFIKKAAEADGLSGKTDSDRVKLFLGGKAGFLGVLETKSICEKAETSSSKAPFGFLPVPMGPDADRYTLTRADAKLFFMPVSCAEWEKAAYLMDKISRRVQSGEEYLKYLKTYMLAGCNDSYRVMTEYLLPNMVLNTACFSENTAGLIGRELYGAVRDGTVKPENAAEFYGSRIQNELDRLFGK